MAEAASNPRLDPQGWIAVASAEHVALGRGQGFVQVCHGKAAPLRRLKPGDIVAYYSPSRVFRGKEKLQAFTGIGVLKAGEPYQADMGGGFLPFRRDVEWLACHDAPILPLLAQLHFTQGKAHWGYQFRFGLFSVDGHDIRAIATAMGAALPWEGEP